MMRRLSRLPRLSDLSFGILATLLSLGVVVLVETGAIGRLLASSTTRTVTAQFRDARQLVKGDPVRISGVNVGDVESVTLDRNGRGAEVTMALNGKPGPIYANAQAQILYRTLLGGAFSVAITRGSQTTGPLSGTIPMQHTGSQVELDDITSVVVGQAKHGLQTLPGQMSEALSNPEYPGKTLSTLGASSPTIGAGLEAVRGEQPATDIPTLVNSADTALRALDAPYGELKQLVSGTAATVDATASQSANLEATLSSAPGLLSQAQTTMVSLRQTLRLANPLLVNLEPSAPRVASTVKDLRSTVRPANRLLDNANPLLRSLRPAVSNLASASTTAEPLLTQLTPSLDELADTIVPYLNEVQPDSKHTFAEMIGPGATALAGIGAYVDNDGGFVRFPATSGSMSVYLPCQTYINDPTTTQVLACQSIGTALSQLFGGTLNTTSGFTNTLQPLARKTK